MSELKTMLRFMGGPAAGRTVEIAANIETVNVPVYPSGDDARGTGRFVYRRCRLDSGEEVLVPDRIEGTAGRA